MHISKSANRSRLKLPDGRSIEAEHDAGLHLGKTFAKCSDFQRLASSSVVVYFIIFWQSDYDFVIFWQGDYNFIIVLQGDYNFFNLLVG